MNALKSLIFSFMLLYFQMTFILCKRFIRNQNTSCGERPRNIRLNRIIGGVNTFYGQVPWQVLVHVNVGGAIMQCGAVLIDENWILTAAHCVYGIELPQIEAYFGRHSSRTVDTGKNSTLKRHNNDSDKPFVSRNSSIIIINDNFNSSTLENDIALIKLNQRITNDDNIQAICLPKQLEDFAGQAGYISGFGVLQYGSKRVPRVLQIVSVPILFKDDCNELFEKLGHNNVINTGKLCAGVIDGGRDACAGDSGGPLTVKRSEDNKWVLAGIISNGIECGQPYTPGVYTQVSAYIDWINAVINSDA